jgi:hypothetical protein
LPSRWNYAALLSAAATRGGRLCLEDDGRFRRQENLSGLQEGPKNALPDGTRYEYDPILKGAVEITPSDRFPVTLVDGKLQRDSGTAARKGEAA